MLLSKQTIERIEQDAKDYALDNYHKYPRIAYIAGATAEATRHEQERKELVEKVNQLMESAKEATEFRDELEAEIKELVEAINDFLETIPTNNDGSVNNKYLFGFTATYQKLKATLLKYKAPK